LRVDDRRDRVRCQLFDFRQKRRSPSWEIGVDNDHATGRHEHGGVATTAAQQKEVVAEFFDGNEFRLFGRRLLNGLDRDGQRRHGDKCQEHLQSSHGANYIRGKRESSDRSATLR
jgi:hypothetical protein